MLNKNSVSIRGDLLSCYTSSLASFLSVNQIDYECYLGLHWYLGLHVAEEPFRTRFVHFSSPLDGPESIVLSMDRKSSFSKSEALKAINDEYRKHGAVIVIGNSFHVPWQQTYHKKQAPHWFLIRTIEADKHRVYVQDPFENINEYGTQQAYQGWIEEEEFLSCIQGSPNPTHVFRSREQLALGRIEAIDCFEGYHWLEVTFNKISKQELNEANVLSALIQVWKTHSNQLLRDDLASAGFHCGIKAIQVLVKLASEYFEDPLFYEMNEDLWVATRQRQMFIYALNQAGIKNQISWFSEFAQWCEMNVLPLWTGVLRIAVFNSNCLKLGRKPRPTLVDQMVLLAEAEEHFLNELEKKLKAIKAR